MIKMIKLICINTSYYIRELSENKIYEGKKDAMIDEEGWYIKFDDNKVFWYPKKCFMPLSEWRDKQINSILDDE